MLTALAVRASLDLDGRVAASRLAARQPSRRLAVRRGQRLTVEQALEALMIVSANDVAVMLAEGAGGSVGRFARAMDAESERLGLRHSRWRNPHGLDAPGHRSSAFDLAILARAVLRDRWLARVVRMRRAAFTSPSGRRHTLTARSRFLLGYRGAVGVKTGLTDGAGHCLAAAATRHGRTLIAIVLDSPDTAADAGRMLDWGFGRGRSARTGLRLPGYVAPAGVTTLLVRPPRVLAPRADLTTSPRWSNICSTAEVGVSEGRSQRMLRTTIGPDDAATVGELLRELGQGVGTPEELRDAAIYWSAAIDPDMECADLQTIAWLLRDASAQRRVPTAKRDRARYWAAYLEGRMAS